MMGSIARYLTDDDARLDALLTRGARPCQRPKDTVLTKAMLYR